METYLTSGKCPRCGKQLKTSDIEGYAFVCEDCDENFYTIEVNENLSDLYEVNIKMTTEEFENKKEDLIKISEKYKCTFLGHDEECQLVDFGWEKGFPDSDTLNDFVKDIQKLFNQLKI